MHNRKSWLSWSYISVFVNELFAYIQQGKAGSPNQAVTVRAVSERPTQPLLLWLNTEYPEREKSEIRGKRQGRKCVQTERHKGESHKEIVRLKGGGQGEVSLSAIPSTAPTSRCCSPLWQWECWGAPGWSFARFRLHDTVYRRSTAYTQVRCFLWFQTVCVVTYYSLVPLFCTMRWCMFY